MTHFRTRKRSLVGNVAVLALTLAVAITIKAWAACGYSHVEVWGQVEDVVGDPVEGTAVVVFVDSYPEALFDIESLQDTWHTDSSGEFLVHGAFYNVALPRWWHRFSDSIDHCGREPKSFTVVAMADGFSVRQVVVKAEGEGFEKIADGRYRVTVKNPISLLSRHPADKNSTGP